MENYKKYCCNTAGSVKDILEILEKTHRKAVIIEEDGVLCGVCTDGDIRRYLMNSNDLDIPVEQVMNKDPIYLYENEMSQAAECMNRNHIDAVPVINRNGKLCNIMFRYDEYKEKKLAAFHVPVVIMAGGKGTRLLPYTKILPKPLMPLNNKTVLECVIDTFYACGYEAYYLILNYKKELIKAYFNELSTPYRVEYIEEKDYMGTGGGLFYLKERISSTFITSNCDIIANIDYAEAVRAHLENKNQITMIAANQNYGIPYGTICTDDDGMVKELREKPNMQFLVNTGVYILEPEVIEDMEARYYDMTDMIGDMLLRGKQVGTYIIKDEDWIDVGNIPGLSDAEA